MDDSWGKLLSLYPDLYTNVDLQTPELFIGRDKSCHPNARFKELKALSKRHCRVHRDAENNKTYLTDLSKNGTFVNKQLVGTGKQVELHEGDVVTLLFPEITNGDSVGFIFNPSPTDEHPSSLPSPRKLGEPATTKEAVKEQEKEQNLFPFEHTQVLLASQTQSLEKALAEAQAQAATLAYATSECQRLKTEVAELSTKVREKESMLASLQTDRAYHLKQIRDQEEMLAAALKEDQQKLFMLLKENDSAILAKEQMAIKMAENDERMKENEARMKINETRWSESDARAKKAEELVKRMRGECEDIVRKKKADCDDALIKKTKECEEMLRKKHEEHDLHLRVVQERSKEMAERNARESQEILLNKARECDDIVKRITADCDKQIKEKTKECELATELIKSQWEEEVAQLKKELEKKMEEHENAVKVLKMEFEAKSAEAAEDRRKAEAFAEEQMRQFAEACHKLETELTIKTDSETSLNHNIASLHQTIQELRATIHEQEVVLREKLSTQHNQLDGVASQNSFLNVQIDKLQQDLMEREQQVAALEQQKQDLERAKDLEELALGKQLAQKDRHITELSLLLDSKSQEHSASSQLLHDLRTQLSQAQTSALDRLNALSRLRKAILIARDSSKPSDPESAIVGLAQIVEKDIGSDTGEIIEKKEMASELMASVRTQLAQWDLQNQSRIEAIASRELQLLSLRDSLASAIDDDRLAKLEKESSLKIYRLTSKNEELKKATEKQKRDIANLRRDVAAAEKTRAALATELDNLQTDYAGFQRNAEADLAQRLTLISDLGRQLQDCKVQLKEQAAHGHSQENRITALEEQLDKDRADSEKRVRALQVEFEQKNAGLLEQLAEEREASESRLRMKTEEIEKERVVWRTALEDVLLNTVKKQDELTLNQEITATLAREEHAELVLVRQQLEQTRHRMDLIQQESSVDTSHLQLQLAYKERDVQELASVKAKRDQEVAQLRIKEDQLQAQANSLLEILHQRDRLLMEAENRARESSALAIESQRQANLILPLAQLKDDLQKEDDHLNEILLALDTLPAANVIGVVREYNAVPSKKKWRQKLESLVKSKEFTPVSKTTARRKRLFLSDAVAGKGGNDGDTAVEDYEDEEEEEEVEEEVEVEEEIEVEVSDEEAEDEEDDDDDDHDDDIIEKTKKKELRKQKKKVLVKIKRKKTKPQLEQPDFIEVEVEEEELQEQEVTDDDQSEVEDLSDEDDEDDVVDYNALSKEKAGKRMKKKKKVNVPVKVKKLVKIPNPAKTLPQSPPLPPRPSLPDLSSETPSQLNPNADEISSNQPQEPQTIEIIQETQTVSEQAQNKDVGEEIRNGEKDEKETEERKKQQQHLKAVIVRMQIERMQNVNRLNILDSQLNLFREAVAALSQEKQVLFSQLISANDSFSDLQLRSKSQQDELAAQLLSLQQQTKELRSAVETLEQYNKNKDELLALKEAQIEATSSHLRNERMLHLDAQRKLAEVSQSNPPPSLLQEPALLNTLFQEVVQDIQNDFPDNKTENPSTETTPMPVEETEQQSNEEQKGSSTSALTGIPGEVKERVLQHLARVEGQMRQLHEESSKKIAALEKNLKESAGSISKLTAEKNSMEEALQLKLASPPASSMKASPAAVSNISRRDREELKQLRRVKESHSNIIVSQQKTIDLLNLKIQELTNSGPLVGSSPITVAPSPPLTVDDGEEELVDYEDNEEDYEDEVEE